MLLMVLAYGLLGAGLIAVTVIIIAMTYIFAISATLEEPMAKEKGREEEVRKLNLRLARWIKVRNEAFLIACLCVAATLFVSRGFTRGI